MAVTLKARGHFELELLKTVNIPLNKNLWDGIKENTEFEGQSALGAQYFDSLGTWIYEHFDSLLTNFDRK